MFGSAVEAQIDGDAKMGLTRGEISEFPLSERVRVMLDVLSSYSSFLHSLIELLCTWISVWCVYLLCVVFMCCLFVRCVFVMCCLFVVCCWLCVVLYIP
jgi:hypothetical protein